MAPRRVKKNVEAILEHLRETLTYAMAAKAYRCRRGKEMSDAEYDGFVEELVNQHYNAGLDEWSDEHLYYD